MSRFGRGSERRGCLLERRRMSNLTWNDRSCADLRCHGPFSVRLFVCLTERIRLGNWSTRPDSGWSSCVLRDEAVGGDGAVD